MNILLIITIAVVFIMTSYSIYLVHREKSKLSTMAGMVISLAIATMAGLLSGFLLGSYSGDMFLSSGISIIIGFTIGFLSGQPLGLIPIMNGAISGLISSLLGAILGVMLQYTAPTVMLLLLLLLYVVITGIGIIFILVETSDKFSLDTQGLSPFAILSAGVVLVTVFLFLYSSDLVKIPDKNVTANTQEKAPQQSSKSDIDVSKESNPKVKMKVTPTGYTPNVILVKKGVQVELEIDNPIENSCLTTFTMPDFNINNVNLKVGTTNLTFTPDKTGEYTFSCGMHMYKGTIIVK
jgi:heme/copper-type cytochrome/quinol oxidase subunit 2